MSIKLLMVLFLAGVLVLFTIQNVAVVDIQFLFWSVSVSRSLVICIVFGVGILIGWFLKSDILSPGVKRRKSSQTIWPACSFESIV